MLTGCQSEPKWWNYKVEKVAATCGCFFPEEKVQWQAGGILFSAMSLPNDLTSFNWTKEKTKCESRDKEKGLVTMGKVLPIFLPLNSSFPGFFPRSCLGFYWSPQSNEMQKWRILSLVPTIERNAKATDFIAGHPNKKWALSRINNYRNKNKNEFFIC